MIIVGDPSTPFVILKYNDWIFSVVLKSNLFDENRIIRWSSPLALVEEDHLQKVSLNCEIANGKLCTQIQY